MRRIQLWALAFGMFMISPIHSFSSDGNATQQTVILKINDLSEDLNVQIFNFFKVHSDVRVLNSCQELGLVVFKFVGVEELGSQATSHLVSAILKDQFSIEQVEVMQNYSMNDVNIDCRVKKSTLLGQ